MRTQEAFETVYKDLIKIAKYLKSVEARIEKLEKILVEEEQG